MTPAKIVVGALGTLAVAGAVVVGFIATRPPPSHSPNSARRPAGGISQPSPSAAVVVAAAPVPDPSCQQEASLKSSTGSPFNLKFVNNTNESVQTLWLDFTGSRVFYKKISAGTSYAQQTYITHPWIVADLQGTCLTLFVTDGNQVSVTVPAGSVAASSPGATTNAGTSLGNPATVIVATDDKAFNPTAVNVRPGEIVEWDDVGFIAHTITFDSAAVAASNDLKLLSSGTWQVRFPTAGTYSYACTVHRGMTGTINVN